MDNEIVRKERGDGPTLVLLQASANIIIYSGMSWVCPNCSIIRSDHLSQKPKNVWQFSRCQAIDYCSNDSWFFINDRFRLIFFCWVMIWISFNFLECSGLLRDTKSDTNVNVKDVLSPKNSRVAARSDAHYVHVLVCSHCCCHGDFTVSVTGAIAVIPWKSTTVTSSVETTSMLLNNVQHEI